jgi:hypothetical protein
MLRRILVIQLLTVLLDPQGTDPKSLAEAFPDEYTPDLDDSGTPGATAVAGRGTRIAWRGASPSLSEALRFLVDREIVTIEPDGRVVAVHAGPPVPEPDGPFSPAEREEGFGVRPLYEWGAGPVLREAGGRFGFDQIRLES